MNPSEAISLLAPAEEMQPLDAVLEAAPPAEGVMVPAGLTLQQVERIYIEHTLSAHKGCRVQTARALGISPRGLYNKYRAWGVEMPPVSQGVSPFRERRALAGELFKEGWTIPRISEHTHIAQGTLYRWLAEDGIRERRPTPPRSRGSRLTSRGVAAALGRAAGQGQGR